MNFTNVFSTKLKLCISDSEMKIGFFFAGWHCLDIVFHVYLHIRTNCYYRRVRLCSCLFRTAKSFLIILERHLKKCIVIEI